jgi:hypothetical protein
MTVNVIAVEKGSNVLLVHAISTLQTVEREQRLAELPAAKLLPRQHYQCWNGAIWYRLACRQSSVSYIKPFLASQTVLCSMAGSSLLTQWAQ